MSQPLKIIGMALFIAMIVKKPVEDEEEEGGGNKIQIDEQYMGPGGKGDKYFKSTIANANDENLV